MKRKYLKMISIVMVMVLLFSVTTTSAMAAETDIGKGEQQLFMEQLGYETKTIEFATSTTEKFSFLTTGGIESFVEKNVLSNGDETYNIVEGILENNVVVKTNGEIYLDGEKVQIIDTENSSALSTESAKNIIMPRAQRHEFTDVCPYDDDELYDEPFSSNQRILIFERAIMYVTEAAFCLAVQQAVQLIPGVGTMLAWGISVAFGLVLQIIKNQYPLSNACALEDIGFVHRENGFTVTSGMSVVRHNMYFFYDTDYESPIPVNDPGFITAYEKFTY